MLQDIFECRTCGLVGSLCCCTECARICHKGHDCKYVHDLHREEALWNDAWCLSVCTSVCRVPRPNSATERSSASNLWTYLEVRRSNVKFTGCRFLQCMHTYLWRESKGTASMFNSRAAVAWLFLYTPAYSRIRLGDQVAGGRGIRIFWKLVYFKLSGYSHH